MTTIKINTKNKLNAISPLLYGVFFEDINYGGDGGLYGELIANRSFEYYDRSGKTDMRKMCWSVIGNTDFTICSINPLNDVHTNYAIVSGEKNSGIRNGGYCGEGFAAQINSRFNLSLYARSAQPITVNAKLVDGSGYVYGSSEINVESEEWQKYECVLESRGAYKNMYLEITLASPGKVELEFISLFPADTFRGRKNGMRRDIAEMISGLKPAFVRFPGGCIVEGRSFENMYCWKDTVGPVENRRTNWNRWQMDEYQNLGYDASDYFQSYGLGFYEYFQFCEDIGAKPIPVVNCGMTCQWHEALTADLDKLDKYIQDVLDLIEFANGDGSGQWSKIRVQMGHPEPFNLEYIGIGNEQWGNEYFERYEVFEKRIRERHPEIKLITSAGWKNRGWEFDLAYDWMNKNKDKAYAVDEHFYKEPEWFFNNIDRYDNYDRSLPKVFIGEWAAHIGADKGSDIRDRKNNWHAALSEAAFLTGAEKNADHVIMTAYAPLLAKSNHNQWQPNLIWFDNDTVYGTPSYYIQKMFSNNLGDWAVDAASDDQTIKISASITDDELIIKLVNTSDADKEITFLSNKKLTRGTLIELSAPLNSENSISNPHCVFPVEKMIDDVYRMCKNSVAVIRYKL